MSKIARDKEKKNHIQKQIEINYSRTVVSGGIRGNQTTTGETKERIKKV